MKTPPFANILTLWRMQPKDTADLFDKCMLQNKPIIRLPLFRRMYLVNDLDAAQRVLQHPQGIYIKAGAFLTRLKMVFGDGLVTSEGELWQSQRKLLQPQFHSKYLNQFGPLITQSTLAYISDWEKNDKSNQKINISHEMLKLILQISASSLFNVDLKNDLDEILRAVIFGQRYILKPVHLPRWLPNIANYRFKKMEKQFHTLIHTMVEKRRNTLDKPDDVLTSLVNFRCPKTQAPLPDKLIADQIITLLVTGHETTGSLLSWLWYELTKHPDVRAKFHQEIDKTLKGKTPTLDDLPALKYTRMIIDEGLRLYPTIWTMHRYNTEEDCLGGYKIPKHSLVFVNPHSIHHDPNVWEDAMKFNPERFNRQHVNEHHKMAYIPFGVGERVCLGKNFALQQLMIIMATISQHYTIDVIQKKNPPKLPLVSLRPYYDLKARLVKRRI